MAKQPSRLQREIRQSRPFRSPGQEAAVALLRTADVLRRFYGEVLARHEITLAQYNVLRVLRGAGSEGLPTLEVGERLIERAPGITRMLDRLEARGWVRRERGREDRRQVLCQLTAEGQELVARLDEPMERADEEAVAGLTREQQRQLIALLEAVRSRHN